MGLSYYSIYHDEWSSIKIHLDMGVLLTRLTSTQVIYITIHFKRTIVTIYVIMNIFIDYRYLECAKWNLFIILFSQFYRQLFRLQAMNSR